MALENGDIVFVRFKSMKATRAEEALELFRHYEQVFADLKAFLLNTKKINVEFIMIWDSIESMTVLGQERKKGKKLKELPEGRKHYRTIRL